jgi:hypothetical protein
LTGRKEWGGRPTLGGLTVTSRSNSKRSGSPSRMKTRRWRSRKWRLRAERVEREWEGNPRVLKLDVDPGEPIYGIEHMRRLLARAGYSIFKRWKRRSGSKKGWHVYVMVDRPVPAMEMVALQAALGSDRYREACNVQRVRTIEVMSPDLRAYWEPRWNVFYDGR